ncbi:MAG: cysteine synthase [Myxococcales bacterium]|nr:cysteine synthase [Myxococcales bacterium]
MIYASITETIGKTPIVRIHRLSPPGVTMYVKVESFNPGGSVKDRLALAIITDAERRGVLCPGQTVIEATSGNTGIALAMVCAARGYPFVAVMLDSFSIERRLIMRAFGARVILTPAVECASGMVRKAEELARKHGWFVARQFENRANPAFHRSTTGPEILQDFATARLDYFVTGWGTGGTLTGTGQSLKFARPDIQVVAAEPAEAQLLAGHEFHRHQIQGWVPDLIPEVLDRTIFDRTIPITAEQAVVSAQSLARHEGIFVGISAGATFAAASRVAREAPEGSVLLAMLPDTGERYLSSMLFEGVNQGSDPE